MASPSPTPTSTSPAVQTPTAQAYSHACVVCARRKVKCDKADPCTNCRKARVPCVYASLVPQPRRPRKRAADAELLARLARYEDLMHQNGVDYAPYANTWVPSGLEKVEVDVGMEAEDEPPRSHPLPNPHPQHPLKSAGNDNGHNQPAHSSSAVPSASRCLWHDLPLELKYPPVQTLRAPDDPLLHPTPSLQSILAEVAAGEAPTLGALHPAPRHIFVLWQRFVDAVNPLTKIVHVPTLQPRVLDASGHPDTVPPPLHALLFAIYTLSVTAMAPGECESVFGGGETKIVLMTRYRTATLRALVAADVLVTRDLEVLQALVLFLFSDPESDLTNSLTGLAVRLGQRLGLHHAATNAKLSVFEQEMRIRLWWPLCGLASRAGLAHASALKTALLELGDLRLPLNVNDADLHPDMAEAPRESESESDSTRPTEMLCVRMKFEFTSWVRSSPATTQAFESIVRGSTVAKTGSIDGAGTEPERGDEAIRRIEAVYESKYVRHLDTRIPLHGLAHAMIQLALARMRFTLYHPRHHPRGRLSTSVFTTAATVAQNEDTLFSAAVQMLEMVDYGLRSPFASHIFTYMTSPFQMDAYIYVLSDLRRRAAGERVAVAWRLVEGLYDAHPALVEDVAKNTLYAALGELALEAWTTREAELRAELRTQGPVTDADVVVPWFIRALRDKDRDKKAKDNTTQQGTDDSGLATMTMANPYTMALDGAGTLDDVDAAWTYWEDFLRL